MFIVNGSIFFFVLILKLLQCLSLSYRFNILDCHFALAFDVLLFFSGAKCEANTFDGERCLYGALTDDIRNLLKSFHVISKRTIRRDLFEEFLRK